MAYEFQVTQDSTDPHPLADWWAETPGWELETSDEAFIRRMISEGHAFCVSPDVQRPGQGETALVVVRPSSRPRMP
jgi:hypothetical protein